MVSEGDVRNHYEANVREVEQLDREIYRLQMRVRIGSEHWRADLEQLARHTERRRALEARRQALSWVLTPGSDQGIAASPHS